MFRRTTALGFPTLIPASALGKNGTVALSNRTTLALIGCGGRGTDVVKNFLQDERVQVMAVCDVSANLTATTKESSKRQEHWAANRRGVWWTKLTAPRAAPRMRISAKCSHARMGMLFRSPHRITGMRLMAVAAARAGKSIYCEKPLSLTVAQGRFMSDVVRDSKVVWQTGSQQRSDIHFRMACEYVRNGRIGKLKQIRVGLASDNRDNNGCAAQTAPTPVPRD